MDRRQNDRWFVAAQASDLTCCEELGQLPPHAMNGRDQPDQDGRVGHGADKEG